jgi:protein TonB
LNSTYRRTGFLLSGLLHLAVAAAFVTQIDHSFEQNEVDDPFPLTLAMFEEAEPPVPVPEPAPEIPAKAEPEKVIPETKLPRSAIKPRPESVTALEPVITPVIHPEPDIKNNSETAARPEPVIEAATEPVARPVAVQAPRLSARHESLKQRYIKVLLKRIHQKKHYPRRARRHREEGGVLVSFVIGQTGYISNIRVSRSSGYADLDKAATKTIERVSPLRPLPEELGMTRWELAVPIAFDLRK